jgi:hypothetical protein
MFAAQVADLACFWLGGFTDGGFAALVGVEVAEGGGAVSIRRNGVDVDVVDWQRKGRVRWSSDERGRVMRECSGSLKGLLTEGAFRCIREVEEVDVEVDASSISVRHSFDLSLYAIPSREGGYVGDSVLIVLGDGGVAELACGLGESKA